MIETIFRKKNIGGKFVRITTKTVLEREQLKNKNGMHLESRKNSEEK